jgi:thioredoxin reductase
LTGDFELRLEDGELIRVRKVILAVGLTHFDYLPPELAPLPKERVTHSSKNRTVDQFKGRNVTVLGGGASALDLAALLHQAGALVQVVARKPAIRFHDLPKPGPRSLSDRLRNPMTGIGAGWKLFLCSNLPTVFRLMPEQFRLERVRRILGPAPGWFIREQVVGKVPFHLGCSVSNVTVPNGHVRLELLDGCGARRIIETEHLIAATGYKVDLRRLTFIAPNDLAQIQSVESTPILSSNFESSLPGLYFVGTSAANTFGPLLRFAVGAQFTARRLSKHLAKSRSRVWAGAPVIQRHKVMRPAGSVSAEPN